jgi:hypothetical protein
MSNFTPNPLSWHPRCCVLSRRAVRNDQKEGIVEGHMDWNEICFLCHRADSNDKLGAWLVGDERRAVHLECWLATYDQQNPRRESRDVESRRSSPHGGEEPS